VNHERFEARHPLPDHLFYDADKRKYQITNEASFLSELEILKIRRSCQQYNSEWSAYQYGFNEARQGKG